MRRFGFCNAKGSLTVEILSDRLRILMGIDVDDLAPPHFHDLNAPILIGRAVRKNIGRGPTNDDCRVVRQAFHPDIVNAQLEVFSQAAEAAEPLAERFALVAFPAKAWLPPKRWWTSGAQSRNRASKSFSLTRRKFLRAMLLTMEWYTASAAELLEAEGAARVSLRQSAERAGLSRQAPYNHFADKEALLAELVREGFERLASRIKADESSGAPPRERLARDAESYIAFGRKKPALFRLMFGKELVDLSRHPSAQAAASAALAQLSTIIAAMAPAVDTSDVMLVAWSLVHGYTSLCIETGLEGADKRKRRARLFARTAEALASLLRQDRDEPYAGSS